jgi:hypothetical protein
VTAQVVMLAAYVTPNQDMAFVVATGYTAISLSLSGFLIRLRDLLAVMRVLSIVTPTRYTLQVRTSSRVYACSAPIGSSNK